MPGCPSAGVNDAVSIGRLTVDRDVGVLLAGDLTAILAFVLVGEVHHGITSLAAIPRASMTLLSFVVGWGVGSVVARSYDLGPREGAGRAAGDGTVPRAGSLGRALARRRPLVMLVVRTLWAWWTGVAVAMVLRSTPWFPGTPAATFLLVALAVGSLLLVAWRVVFLLWARTRLTAWLSSVE